MDTCVFCQLINNGEIQQRVVHENKDFIAFLAIAPYVTGHTLIIPRVHSQYIWDVAKFADYFKFVQEVSGRLRVVFKTDKIDVLVSGGQVPHAHIHLLPSLEDQPWAQMKDYIRTLQKEIPKGIDAKIVNTLKF